MRDQPSAEEALDPSYGSIDELIHDDKHPRLQMLSQRTDRTYRNHIGHTGALQGVDIGPKVDLGGRNPVAAAMPREKHHLLAFQFPEQEFIRSFAERRLHPHPALMLQSINLVHP